MKNLKIAVLPIVLLALLALGGCATTVETVSRDQKSGAVVLKKEATYGTEYTIHLFQRPSPSVTKKVTVSAPIVVEKDMATKKTPDATEEAVAEAVYAGLRGELASKGILAEKGDGDALSLNLRVHYVSTLFVPTIVEYLDRPWSRNLGGQILVVGALLGKGQERIAQMDFIDNEGTLFSYQKLTDRMPPEIATQIEKILKEGVTIGESPK